MPLLDGRQRKRISKKMSYALRHHPDALGLQVDAGGWTTTNELLKGFQDVDWPVTLAEIQEVVTMNPKQRFEFSEDGQRIRARQGHSIEVDLGYMPTTPPTWLYHGTPERNRGAIEREGLRRMSRHHVHLSPDIETARIVGNRRGRCIIFAVRAADLAAEGHVFYRTGNDVWLVDEVPPAFLSVPEGMA